MGLAAPKRRSKIGNDPNNTAWTRDTTTYGHRILASHGWAPGQYLGAKDAAHAAHYTAANASHIRVALREDNLGLGARRAGAPSDPLADQTFGLSGFQDLLGRLNGKSDSVLEKERGARQDLERRRYLERKWGSKGGMGRFVTGGFLVGDRIVEEQAIAMPLDAGRQMEIATDVRIKDVEQQEDDEDLSSDQDNGRLKEESKEQDTEEGMERKNEKRRRKKKRNDALADNAKSLMLIAEEIKETKEERRKRRLERRARKEAKQVAKRGESDNISLSKDGISAETKSTPENTYLQTAQTQVETSHIKPLAGFTGARHMVRQRYIRQKRMAMMDPKALNEILMVKR